MHLYTHQHDSFTMCMHIDDMRFLLKPDVGCMLQMVSPSKSLYSTEQAVQWLTEIGEALQYMHTLTPAVS